MSEELIAIAEVLPEITEDMNCPEATESDDDDIEQKLCDYLNDMTGTLEGYDCDECKNRGGSYFVVNGAKTFRACECMITRKNLHNIKKSNAEELIALCTFDSFQTSTPWQLNIKNKAELYVENHSGKWFYIGGQVGCGKTHICTAIIGKFLSCGLTARYMRWKDDSTRLKSIINDDKYETEIAMWKNVDVLYIDDFFKVPKGKEPTQGDINLAFEILNHRYIKRKQITIISCEHDIESLIDFDEAVGSRIYERSKGFTTFVENDKQRNYRLS